MTAHRFLEALRNADLVTRTGRVRKVTPTVIEADGPNVPLGTICEIRTGGAAHQPAHSGQLIAEVVALHDESVRLVPLGGLNAVRPGARVVAMDHIDQAPVGDVFCGRVVDALGRPVDGLGAIETAARAPLRPPPTGALQRSACRTQLRTGVRAIDGLLTLGYGQRIGIFAASGLGKTVLVTQLANQIRADRCVICLVGERGREVEDLWTSDLEADAKARTTIVAATSDEAAAMRARAVRYAAALAAYWRNQGRDVLLVIDSVTRFAMALRELGLAAGEPPTTRGYTPSVFAEIPKVVEQSGPLRSGGSITTVATVLSETDEVDDPICEMMKSLLDGHIVLSRSLAEGGHFPAIDAPRSLSRLANALQTPAHRQMARRAVQLLSAYDASKTLIEAGVYVAGGDSEIDAAINARPALGRFLRQGQTENVAVEAGLEALSMAVEAA